MNFKKITPEDVAFFQSIEGIKGVFTDTEILVSCASDETEDLHYLP